MAQIVVQINLNRNISQVKLDQEATVEALLNHLQLYPDAHIVLRDRQPIPLTEKIRDGEELRIIKVASGG